MTARRLMGALAAGVALVAAATALATGPATASVPGSTASHPARDLRAAAWDGNIYLYYSASANSSWSKYAGWVNDFAGHTFAAGGEGHGRAVKNNVNRAWNNDANWTARIYYNENQNASGPAPYDDFFPGNSRQLNSSVRNNNASLSWWR
ncbi:hypothetical protein [Streptomyces clavuligerus]|uniref:Secreted protein n=1 Tax=Streptomyces clavuligerus TaxID=1901 RepID=E2Q652_STRCL|nr:hypothetical protein [Streptomyces clavuligerus]ANW21615.1 hypothetical protein BB341_27080 [Streptomyces clavuligerus]EFG05212.1 Hypothetical protein SCLAV_0136 [Streptomyces clavuligerus]WDN50478.1 hypothetical protein LL058_00645 [Streptomyces clavuligerus]